MLKVCLMNCLRIKYTKTPDYAAQFRLDYSICD